MNSNYSPNLLKKECAHYDEHRRYLLHFLDLDRTALDRWLIRQILRTWDRQIALIDPEMIRGKVVLEAGCGNPRFLFYFKKLGARRAIGCDLSERFVARGLKKDRTYVHTHAVPCPPDEISLLYGDVNGPVTEGLKADTIVCFQSLHHLNIAKFVVTCSRLLSPGGHLIVSDPMGSHPLRGLGNKVGRRTGLLSPSERAFPPEAVIAQFGEHGFEAVQIRSLNPTLEIYFQLTELLTTFSPKVAFYTKLPMAFLRPLESLLEGTLLRRAFRLGWRYFIVLRKSPGGRTP